ncbi:outer membrane usher protein [Sphingomonas naasensis]|uniref:Fimbrial biogenesis outer membrane usher protein n=1 Tax=Sphingomonas naasensis TaxID=1344951 RepID=A0A4S1WT80_9SPHN|nr:fimbrial biogenesis outer membrane usher protein [Sphingomonas naasensis]NIJ18675.1 outer membrane usher protein [Sphingomonas naasensis]TGX45915.1 fimbrial biogenesis outer membrane usher protein [Sphingomonas naasensis]
MNSNFAGAGLALASCLYGAAAYGQVAGVGQAQVVIDPDASAAGINPTGRPIVLTAPVMDGTAYLGDATLTLDPNGQASFSAVRLIALLEPRIAAPLTAKLRARLSERGRLDRADLQGVGIGIRYDPQALQIMLDIAASSRASRSVQLGDDSRRGPVTYTAPAGLSAYLNIRGSLDWVQQGADEGLAAPVTFLDGAVRAGGVVLEGEANWQVGAVGPDFQRRGTRLVYDDRHSLVRWTAGDLQTLSRGFQSAPEIAGLSVSRFYSLLDPQTIIRPRGSRSFQLERRSTVEVRVNDQLVRRLELDPGTFDLRDFPFTQGANDVRLTITDDAGRTQSFDFDIFLDQSQLAAGLSEFGLYAGTRAPLGRRGPIYSDDLAFSGFYRRGLNDRLTLGANAQADGNGWMGGVETVVATPIGSFGGFASASHVNGVGSGWASILTFQRTISRASDRADALSFSLETRSRNFAPIGTGLPSNPYSYIAGVSYNSAISDAVYAGLDARYSKGRDAEPDVGSIRATGGWRISPDLSFTGDLSWERDGRGNRIAAFLSLTLRLDRASSLRGDYDSRSNRTRLTYQTYHGTGTGAYNFSADIERSDLGAGANANAIYYTNRAELGLSHFGTFERDLGGSTGQRTSLRFGTALAVADGSFSVGRPIQDAFAIVRAHPSLRDADILVDATGKTSAANTGALGTAVQPSLSSYSERNLQVTAPDAPLGANLGEGSFRLLPPYRGGYRLTVGSDYMVSVVGRLLGANGEPIALVAGSAIEEAHPEREPVPLFTNSTGRFGATGLAPGRWRITLTDADKTRFDLVIPKGAEATIAVGELRPGAR